jgi:hypothetical protein
MKIIHTIFKTLLALLIISPILGVLGIFPAPTRDLYNTEEAYQFIVLLMNSGYVMWMMAIVFLISLILIIKNKMAAVALLILPITLNIVGFHAFLDGGLLTGGAIMGNVLLLLNIYFLYQNRTQYKALV